MKHKIIKKMCGIALKLKSKLPCNGDWLFVTQAPNKNKKQQKDLADIFCKKAEFIKRLPEINDNGDIVYKLASEYYDSSAKSIDITREKASTLLNTASFVAAIMLSTIAFISSIDNIFEKQGLYIVFVAVVVVMIVNFFQTLILSIMVLRKNTSIEISPQDIIDTQNKKTPLKEMAARKIEYACKTQKHTLKKINMVILAQTAFRNGIIYFAILLLLQLLSSYRVNDNRKKPYEELIEKQNKLIEIEQKNRTSIVIEITEDLNRTNLKIRDIEKKVMAIEKRVDAPKKGSNAQKSGRK